MRDFTVKFLKCAKFHGKFMEGVWEIRRKFTGPTAVISRCYVNACRDEFGILYSAHALYRTLKLQSNRLLYSNTVIGTLAVDGWAVTFGTARGVPRGNQNVVKIAIFGLPHWLKHRITRKLLKIDRYIGLLRGVSQALNCLSIHATYCVIVAGASPGQTKMWAAVPAHFVCSSPGWRTAYRIAGVYSLRHPMHFVTYYSWFAWTLVLMCICDCSV